MRFAPSLTASLLLASALLLAPGCAHKAAPPLTAYPPAADLRVKPKPQLAPEALESEQALLEYDVALEAWGDEGWLTVGRLCRWAKVNGMQVDCPKAPG